jgi:hypothetical protein
MVIGTLINIYKNANKQSRKKSAKSFAVQYQDGFDGHAFVDGFLWLIRIFVCKWQKLQLFYTNYTYELVQLFVV